MGVFQIIGSLSGFHPEPHHFLKKVDKNFSLVERGAGDGLGSRGLCSLAGCGTAAHKIIFAKILKYTRNAVATIPINKFRGLERVFR